MGKIRVKYNILPATLCVMNHLLVHLTVCIKGIFIRLTTTWVALLELSSTRYSPFPTPNTDLHWNTKTIRHGTLKSAQQVG